MLRVVCSLIILQIINPKNAKYCPELLRLRNAIEKTCFTVKQHLINSIPFFEATLVRHCVRRFQIDPSVALASWSRCGVSERVDEIIRKELAL